MKRQQNSPIVESEMAATVGLPTKDSVSSAPRRSPSWFRDLLIRPEAITVVLLIFAFVAGAILSPYFLDLRFLLDSTSLYMEVGIMALAVTLVLISGNLDLSFASGLALVGVVIALLYSSWGLPMLLVIPLALLLGVVLGLFNGVLVARLGLPSLTVTLGTLALYRGIAQIILGDHSLGRFPEWFVGIDYRKIGDLVPLPLILFLVLAAAFGLLLHKTILGRWIYAIGTNEQAARFSGIPVRQVKLLVFILSGVMMAIAGIVMTSRFGVSRFDAASGKELDVITAIVLGGTDINGGRGSIFGTVVALFLLGLLKNGMGLANIQAPNQLAVTGTLLIVAIILSNITARLRK